MTQPISTAREIDLRPDGGIVVDGQWYWLPEPVYALLRDIAAEDEE